MRSFWNSVGVVDAVTRVFPMCCIRLSLLNIQSVTNVTSDHKKSFICNEFKPKRQISLELEKTIRIAVSAAGHKPNFSLPFS